VYVRCGIAGKSANVDTATIESAESKEGNAVDQMAEISGEIDRTSPEAFYLQLAKLIEDAIDRGTYKPGDKIPGETELCRIYDLARSTVRETLRTLEDRNRIRVVARRGAFVIDPKGSGWGLQVADGFFEGEVHNNQRQVETKVLEAKLAPPPGAAARALNRSPEANALLLRRLRRLDGNLALYSINYLLPEFHDMILASEVMQPHGSLNRVLKANGHRTFGARRTVEAIGAPAQIAKLLEIPEGTPVLLITSISWDQDQKPFDFYTSWVRSDIVKVTVEASANIGAP
jgi:GntR family transcriptional regulator